MIIFFCVETTLEVKKYIPNTLLSKVELAPLIHMIILHQFFQAKEVVEL